MNQFTDPEFVKNFLRANNLKPKDYFGQNFLVDEIALEKIVEAAELKKSDIVLEVGPGLGVLTQELSEHSGRVVAVEKDKNLAQILAHRTELKNVEVVTADILKFNFEKHIGGKYKVVANIPYYLTSALLKLFFQSKTHPTVLVLMVQKEVGERIVAPAGSLSILGISVQMFADAEIVAQVPRTSFSPTPEVDSVIIKIEPKNKYPEIEDEKLFFRILKIAFAGKRKQIHNTLSNGLHLDKLATEKLLEKSGIKGTDRPQDLSIEQWVELYKQIKA